MVAVLSLQLAPPLARYPPLAHWAASNVTCDYRADAAPTAVERCRREYLMVPLREILDESYSAHLCVVRPGASVPGFCH